MAPILLLLALHCNTATLPASACTCITGRASVKSRVRDELRRYDAVFVGSVTSFTDTLLPFLPEAPQSRIRVRKAVVRLELSWKGPVSDSLVIWTGMGSGDCGYPFEIGERYLVFAIATDSTRLSAHTCSLTQPFEGAGEYIKALGDPRFRREVPWDSARP